MILEFTPAEVELIANIMAQRPYGEVWQLIDKIRSQATQQNAPPQGNGADAQMALQSVN